MNCRARITDDWLPLPAETLKALGWGEGDIIDIEQVGDAVVLTLVAKRGTIGAIEIDSNNRMSILTGVLRGSF